jgi:hypothetical protein
MSTTITTRQTAGTGATVKGAPLTNAELDANFLNLNTAVLPVGGTAGQVLSKVDGTNFNAVWIDNFSTALKISVKNSTGVTITKGSVVYVSGATGANVLVALAQANAESTSSQTLGLVETDIANGASGYVIYTGTITGLNTSAYAEGDPVYLSGTTAGGIVVGLANKPSAPIHLVYLGVVTRSNINNGEIQIRVSNGWELNEIHDVAIASKANNDIIQYDSTSGLWKNVAAATARTNLGLAIGTNVQAWDGDLDAIAALADTSGFLKKTAANTWSLDTNTYLTTAVTSVGGTGTVSGLSLSGTVTTTGNLTLSGTLAVTASNFSSQTANTFLAAPNGAAGVPTFRALVAADVPTLNQSTTGNAATATTATNIAGGAANRIPYNSAAGTTAFAVAPTVDSTVLSWTSAGGFAWATVGGATISDDTTTAATYYPTFATATSGTFSTAKVSSSKLTYNPSTGVLTSVTVTSSSDESLKTDWQDLASDFVDRLAQAKHGVFTRITEGTVEAGVSAQNWKTVLPQTVIKGNDGLLSVNYGGAALVSAIQIAKRLVALEATVAKLVD